MIIGVTGNKSYNEWLQAIGKKTRNMVRRAEKSGIKVAIVEPNDKLAEGIWKIYNETPIRQARASITREVDSNSHRAHV
jgi:lipid II:glycine glycyltransferase (peptidoglycan interpeptide bridge formation enzyme)